MNTAETQAIAFIFDSQHTPRIHVEAALAARQRADELHYELQQFDIQDHSNPIDLRRHLVESGHRGIIIGFHDHVQSILAIDWHPLAVVCMGFEQELPRYHAVCKDNHEAVLRAWEKMREAGYQRIGCLLHHHEPPIRDDTIRYRACLEAQMGDDLNFIPPLRQHIGEHAKLAAWLEEQRPDAILGFSIADLNALRSLEVELPFACLHVHGHHPSYEGIAGCIVNISEQAQRAIDKLDELIRCEIIGCPAHPRCDYLPMAWRAGLSLFP